MADTGVERTITRPGRCANHPGVAQVAVCELCRRPLCLSCVVPVRGALIGPECLSKLVEDAPASTPPPKPVVNGDLLAMVGFGLVVVLSILPWSRFGDASGLFQAWRVHWSLLAVVTGAAGLCFALIVHSRPQAPGLEAAVYLGLALVTAGAAFLHLIHPPPLSSGSIVPTGALVGAGLAAVGAGVKGLAMVRASRPRGGVSPGR